MVISSVLEESYCCSLTRINQLFISVIIPTLPQEKPQGHAGWAHSTGTPRLAGSGRDGSTARLLSLPALGCSGQAAGRLAAHVSLHATGRRPCLARGRHCTKPSTHGAGDWASVAKAAPCSAPLAAGEMGNNYLRA